MFSGPHVLLLMPMIYPCLNRSHSQCFEGTHFICFNNVIYFLCFNDTHFICINAIKFPCINDTHFYALKAPILCLTALLAVCLMFVTYLFDQKAIDGAGLTQNLEGRHTQTVEDPQGRGLVNTPQTGSVWNSV